MYEDIFNPFGVRFGETKAEPKPEKGVQIHGRQIDGAYYVRAADIALLLETNSILPKIAARLRAADK